MSTLRGKRARRITGVVAAAALVAPIGVALLSGSTVGAASYGTQRSVGFTGFTGGPNGAYGGGLAVDGQGDVYAADEGGGAVYEMTPAGVQTQLPFGTLTGPDGMAVDSAGDVFVSDYLNGDTATGRVQELKAGTTTPITLPLVGVGQAFGLAVDSAGDLFASDYDHERVVELSAGGVQSTLPFTGFSAQDPPTGVAVDSAGDVYVVNTFAGQLDKLTPGGVQTNLTLNGLIDPYGVALDSAGDVFVGDNDGGGVIEIPAGTTNQTRLPFSSSGIGAVLGVAVDTAGDVFAKIDAGPTPVWELPVKAQSNINEYYSPNPAYFGQTVTIHTQVLAANGLPATLTGTVTFTEGTTVLGVVPVQSNQANLSLPNLSVGTHNITATYSGDANFTSVYVPFPVVIHRAVTTLTATPEGVIYTSLSATLTGPGGPVSGATVTFSKNGLVVGSATTNNQGVASYPVFGLALLGGSYTASYAGSPGYYPSSGNAAL
jgi:serine/threonine-protein kinase